MGAKPRQPRSLLGFYRQDVLPLLVAAGFEGTVATSQLVLPRSSYWAHATGKGGSLAVRVVGYEDGGGYTSFLDVKLSDVESSAQEAAIGRVFRQVRAVLEGIAERAAAAPVRAVDSLEEALRALLERLGRTLGPLRVDGVERQGREMIVRSGGESLVVDRTALLTCVRELWGQDIFPAKRRPSYCLHEAETRDYIEQLARLSIEEARGLCVHIYSPYRVYFDDPESLNARLFPEPMYASTHLNAAATSSHLVWRSIPHAEKGKLADRVAATSVIESALGYAHPSDRYAPELADRLPVLIDSLSKDDAPLVREAAWVLHRALAASRLTSA